MFRNVRGERGLAVGGVTLLCYGTMILSGMLGWVILFAVSALVVIVGEVALATRFASVGMLVEKAGLGPTVRWLFRDLAAVLLVISTVGPGTAGTVMTLLLPAGLWALAVGTTTLQRFAERTPFLVQTRNIDPGTSGLRPTPPRWAQRVAGLRMPLLNFLLLPAAVAAALTDGAAPVGATGLTTLTAGFVVAGVLAVNWLRGRGGALETLPALHSWMTRVQPEVALYFAGPAKDIYQVNMWLAPVEASGRRAVVLLRNEQAFAALADTRLPVVSVPAGVDFMNLEFTSLRVALYVANVGANIHLLREPGVRHVFVGHGDSDKQASVNPYSKVYDEVWVAGRAGRERYERAAVGVRDEDIVEIGRPQLAGVRTFGSEAVKRPFTVLYAPTWEGWLDDDLYHTSLVLMGERIVRGLLQSRPEVRLIYKPHPLTGSRSPKAKAVHERMVGLVRAAGGDPAATSLDGSRHLVVTGRVPALFDCFNQTDLLISDVSSVVSDFVQSRRPYVVANPGGLPEDEFRRKYPTARAAYLLSRDVGELEKILGLTRAGDDPMAEARRELKTHLLGPDEPNAMERFRAEIARLSD